MWKDARQTLNKGTIVWLSALTIVTPAAAIPFSFVLFYMVAKGAWGLVPRLLRDGMAQDVIQLVPLVENDYKEALQRMFKRAVAIGSIPILLPLIVRHLVMRKDDIWWFPFAVYVCSILCLYYWLAIMPELGCFTRSIALGTISVFLALLDFLAFRFAWRAVENGVWWSAVLIIVAFLLPSFAIVYVVYRWAISDYHTRIAEAVRRRIEREPFY